MSELCNLDSLRRFDSEHAKVTLRLGANPMVLAANNPAAIAAQTRAEKINKIISPIARKLRAGYKVTNWTGVHVPFIHCFYDTALALEVGSSLTRARGDGRLSTMVDNVRPIGSGFNASAESIIRFNELNDLIGDIEMQRVDKGTLHATFPSANLILKSGPMFTRMLDKLLIRDQMIKSGAKLGLKEKKEYLISGRWNAGRIIEQTVEFAARSFAFGLDDETRHNLISNPIEDISITQAFESLSPRLLAPA